MYQTKAQRLLVVCVDLDGTLLRSDLLHEALVALLKSRPWMVFVLLYWLLGGKAAFKERLALCVDLDPAALPFNDVVVARLRQARTEGAQVWLATASPRKLVAPLAEWLGIFDGVFASDGGTNLSGGAKAAALVERFGARGFAYYGNGMVDVAVWREAAAAVVVNAPAWVVEAARAACPQVEVVDDRKPALKTWLRAMRPHQWAKNALVFVPLLAAHQWSHLPAIGLGLAAFLAFGFCASSVYLLNDLLDLPADRAHPRKRRRPFASGDLSLLAGAGVAMVLLAAGVAIACWVGTAFAGLLAFYYILTTAYSFRLKRLVLVDALALAMLYTLRIIAGAAAVGVMSSFWLLAFSMFLFLSLAILKRFTEMLGLKAEGKLTAHGRGYHVEDLPLLQSLGTAAGYLAVLVLALYINSPAVSKLYSQPLLLWLLCPLALYWISRIWLLAHRGEMHDDPVVFALTDRASHWVAAAGGLVVVLAA